MFRSGLFREHIFFRVMPCFYFIELRRYTKMSFFSPFPQLPPPRRTWASWPTRSTRNGTTSSRPSSEGPASQTTTAQSSATAGGAEVRTFLLLSRDTDSDFYAPWDEHVSTLPGLSVLGTCQFTWWFILLVILMVFALLSAVCACICCPCCVLYSCCC